MKNSGGSKEIRRLFGGDAANRYIEGRKRNRAANRAWFLAHPGAKKKYNDKHYARGRATIIAAKNRPCLDCGVQYTSCVMQFDHRDPATKKFTVGCVGGKSDEILLAEIAKCDVVCANCHAMRTQAQREAKKLPVE